MSLLSRLRLDGFMLAIIAAAVLASVLPARGAVVPVLDWTVTIAISLLFFLYGARLSTSEALAGLRHWRLHAVILAFTYLAFPVIGLALGVLAPSVIPDPLYAGVLFLTLVPSTVQSSIAFTSIAGGNVAGAIVSASASNLLGVVLTPLLVVATMATTGDAGVSGDQVVHLMLQLLLPFVLGQLSRRWTAGWVKRNHAWLKHVDRASIVLVVYSAFSSGMREHMWSQVSGRDLVVLLVLCLALVALMLWLTWAAARALGFDRSDSIAIQFCGTKKSLATGLPMATVLFAGQPVGLMVLPLMVFHQVQLMACSWLAARYARRAGVDARRD